jgi:hypothetical protein
LNRRDRGERKKLQMVGVFLIFELLGVLGGLGGSRILLF